MPNNINDVSANIDKLNSSINDTLGKITNLNFLLGDFKRVLPTEELRKITVTYDNLTRSLMASRREVELMNRSVSELSKTTLYYSRDVLVQMSAQLKASTSALTAFGKANQDLVTIFSQTYKRDAPEYLKIFERLNQQIPILTTRMQTASTSASTFFEIFKNEGAQGISAYLTSIGKMESETKDTMDTLDDKINKFFNNFKNQALSMGESVNRGFLGKLDPKVLSTLTFLAAGGGAIAGIGGLTSSRMGALPEGGVKALFGNDREAGGLGGFGGAGALGARAATALPAMLFGGGMAASFIGQGGYDNPQAWMGLGGAGLAGHAAGSVFGKGAETALVSVIVEGFGQGALNALNAPANGYANSPGADPKVQKRIEDRVSALNEQRGFFDTARSATYNIASDIKQFFTGKGLPQSGYDKQVEQITYEEMNKEAAERKKADERQQALYNTRKFGVEQYQIARKKGISEPERDKLMQAALSKHMEYLDNSLQRNDLTSPEQGQLTTQREIERRQVLRLIERQGTFSSADLGLARAQFGFINETSLNRSAHGVGAGRVLETNAAQQKQLEEQISQYKKVKDDPEAYAKIQQAEAELLTLRKEQLSVTMNQYASQNKLKDIELQSTSAWERFHRAEGGTLQKINEYRTQEKDLLTEKIAINNEAIVQAGKLGADGENIKRNLQLENDQLVAKRAELTLQMDLDQLQTKRIAMQKSQALTSMYGDIGPEGSIQFKRQEATQLRAEAERANGVQKTQLEAQAALAEAEADKVEQYDLGRRQLERQNTLIGQQVQLYQALRAPATVLATLKQQELGVLKQQLTNEIQLRSKLAAKGDATPEQLFAQDQKINNIRIQMAQAIDFQRRTVAEQFTEQMINMPSGSYLNPNLSQYALLGSGYYTGISQRPGAKSGSYQAQLAGMFGEGANERSPWEQFMDQVFAGDGLPIKGVLSIDSDGRGTVGPNITDGAKK